MKEEKKIILWWRVSKYGRLVSSEQEVAQIALRGERLTFQPYLPCGCKEKE